MNLTSRDSTLVDFNSRFKFEIFKLFETHGIFELTKIRKHPSNLFLFSNLRFVVIVAYFTIEITVL